LEDAVYKLSGHAARKFGMQARGIIAVGAIADIAIFDPEMITDVATYDSPQQTAIGMVHVFVGGEHVVRDGEPVAFLPGAPLPGRFVRFNHS
jgi:N-acyl-D-amino-acid deacylase